MNNPNGVDISKARYNDIKYLENMITNNHQQIMSRIDELKIDHEYQCRFDVTHDDMDHVKRFVRYFRVVEDKVVEGFTFLFLLGAMLLAYFLVNKSYFDK